LPTCVQSYLAHSIRDTRLFRLFTLGQRLQLRFTPSAPWRDMCATNHACPLKPAFLFRGSVRMGPLTSATGYECLLQGHGYANWRLWGIMQVSRHAGELADRAAHTRWLAEAACFPQALYPSHFLRWEQIQGRANGE